MFIGSYWIVVTLNYNFINATGNYVIIAGILINASFTVIWSSERLHILIKLSCKSKISRKMFPKLKNKTEFEKQKQTRSFNNFIRISSPTHSITFLLSYKCSQQYLIPSKSISSKKNPHKHTFLSSSHFHLFRHPHPIFNTFPT